MPLLHHNHVLHKNDGMLFVDSQFGEYAEIADIIKFVELKEVRCAMAGGGPRRARASALGVRAADAVSEPEIAISSLEIESVERPHQPRSARASRS